MPLDLDFVRSQFPALGGGWAYFDNAGGSQVLRPVAERVAEYLLTTSVQTGASYEGSQRATERLTEARARMARFLNARRPAEVVFGHSATVLLRFLATAMGRRHARGSPGILRSYVPDCGHRAAR